MANTTKWVVDPSHSELQFKVKHLVISTVTGAFKVFDGEIHSSEDSFEGAEVSFKADINSVDTGNEQRDGHLKSADFFHAEEHPTMHFKSTQVTKTDDSHLNITGELTIRGVSQQVAFDVEFGGIAKDPWGNTRAGFEINGKINRKDFGLMWSAVTEAGGAVVSDEVRIHGNVEFTKVGA
jgi:polyisoprenoid-binding protein YceI